MNGAASILQEENKLFISGQLDFGTVVGLWKNSLPLLSSFKDKIILDLSSVTSSDSSGLSLLLEWMKYAKQKNLEIIFQNLPSQLKAIAAVAGVDKFLSKN